MKGFAGGVFERRRALLLRVAGAGLAAVMLAPVVYALLVLQPLAAENEAMRVRAAGLAALSGQVAELGELLAALRRDVDGEAPSYRDMLHDLRGWRAGAHTFVSRIAADAGLEVTAMEWTEAEPVTPAFETDERLPWLRTGVVVKLAGAWRAHRDFAGRLSRCDCLIQIVEQKVAASARTGAIEAAMSLLIYYPAQGARV